MKLQIYTSFLLSFPITFTVCSVYPDTRRDETIIDDYFGVKVSDPYRSLEKESVETSEFLSNQKTLLENFFEKVPERETIRTQLTDLVNYPKYGAPILKQGRYFYFHNTGLQGHDVLLKQDTLDAEPKLLLDPNELSEDGSTSLAYYKEFSPNGKIFVYSLSRKGSDWVTGHFLDTESGDNFADVLDFIKWPDFSFSHDNAGLFYSRFPLKDDGTPLTTNPQIYYHKLGESQSNDTFITDELNNPEWFLFAEVSHCGNYLIVKPQPDFKANSVKVAALNGSTLISNFIQVANAEEGSRFIYVTNTEEEFIFLSDKDAPNFQLIRVSINVLNGTVGQRNVLVPEHEKNILKWVSPIDGDKIVLCYFEDVKHKLEVRFINNGSLMTQIDLPLGVISDQSLFRENNEFFFKFENLLLPGRIYHCKFRDSFDFQIYKEVTLSNSSDMSDFVMKQIFFPSKDGTEIPMYIAHRKDLELNGSAPTLLFGYGGFNVDLLPTFSPFNFYFVEHFNGIYASVNIRGGAEYGEKWHEGGMLLKKQNSFDDFQFAAEYLIKTNYTNPQKIVIQGSSNGGLLVAVSVNQRPDLFNGVALPDVGLLDMLRFQKFAIGFAWCGEYGCSDNETHFYNLYKYSPLHNVKWPSVENVQYPAMLVSTADHDERVLPGFSYKYIAEIQHTIGNHSQQTNPLLLRVTADAGHNSENKPISLQIEDFGDSFAFVTEVFRRGVKNEAISSSFHKLSVFNSIFATLLYYVI